MSRNLFEYHPTLGYRFIPGIRARIRHESGGYTVRCNRAGFRCEHEVTQQKPPETFRIILFGDSYTAGDGVSNGYRFSDRIESQFEHMQVLNFALPGSGTDQQYLVFREYARHIEYDLMLLCPLVENIRRNMVSSHITLNTTDGVLVKRTKPYFLSNGEHLKLHNTPVPKEVAPVLESEIKNDTNAKGPLYLRLQGAVRSLYQRYPGFHCFMQRVCDIRSPIEYEDPKNPGWQLMKAILSTWAQESTTNVVICPLPTFSHVFKCMRADSYRQRFAELATPPHVEVVDILPEFWQLDGRQRKHCRFRVDDHPSRLGHQVIADALIRSVQKHYDRWKQANA